jgi:hypothetical protein
MIGEIMVIDRVLIAFSLEVILHKNVGNVVKMSHLWSI